MTNCLCSCATPEIGTKISLQWAHKQFATRAHALFYMIYTTLLPLDGALILNMLYEGINNIDTATPCKSTHLTTAVTDTGTGNSTLICLNSLRPRQNGRLFADNTFKGIFLNKNIIISTKNSLKFVPKILINNIPALVLIMAWRRPGDKPLFEPMLVKSLTHICVTRLNEVLKIHIPQFIWKVCEMYWITFMSSIKKDISVEIDNNIFDTNKDFGQQHFPHIKL